MSDSLGARLREARESLSTWHDRLNGKWAEAEEFLRTVHLSEPVWAAFKGDTISDAPCGPTSMFDTPYEVDIEHCLYFRKVNGEWRICYALGEIGDPESYEPKPILDCSLEIRKMALEGLPKLLEAVVDSAEAEASLLESALGAASEALASIKR